MKIIEQITNPDIDALNAMFVRHGARMWPVGGCVRDVLDGRTPNDVDLATDATPDQQIAIYEAEGIHYIPTGLQHGTVTAHINGTNYEVTTLRTESNHDGRWADTTFTRSLTDDLARRDLTINAMAVSFDGELIDPFGGRQDLVDRRIRFVGSPDERMQEDYLRILRWVRFHGRFATGIPLDQDTKDAAMRQAGGLRTISRERVWTEMAKIVSGPAADQMLFAIHQLGLAPHIDFPRGINAIARAKAYTSDPVSLLAYYIADTTILTTMAINWKWSSREKAQGRLVSDRAQGDVSFQALKVRAAVHGEPVEWLAEAARVRGEPDVATRLLKWKMPEFPIHGNDLKAIGVPQGPKIGRIMAVLKCEWGDSGFRIGREVLLKHAEKAALEID